jgi:hypothetical protein
MIFIDADRWEHIHFNTYLKFCPSLVADIAGVPETFEAIGAHLGIR